MVALPKGNYFYTFGSHWVLSKWQVRPKGMAQALNLGPGATKFRLS